MRIKGLILLFMKIYLATKRGKARNKKFNNYELMFKFIDSLKPKSVFPFAAGCVYGGEKQNYMLTMV